jgi:hypothetical protein
VSGEGKGADSERNLEEGIDWEWKIMGETFLGKLPEADGGNWGNMKTLIYWGILLNIHIWSETFWSSQIWDRVAFHGEVGQENIFLPHKHTYILYLLGTWLCRLG